MGKERHCAVLVVNREFLIKSLGLPADVILHDLTMGFGVNEGPVLLSIEHESLPVSINGGLVPRVSALFEKTSETTPAKFKGFRQ